VILDEMGGTADPAFSAQEGEDTADFRFQFVLRQKPDRGLYTDAAEDGEFVRVFVQPQIVGHPCAFLPRMHHIEADFGNAVGDLGNASVGMEADKCAALLAEIDLAISCHNENSDVSALNRDVSVLLSANETLLSLLETGKPIYILLSTTDIVNPARSARVPVRNAVAEKLAKKYDLPIIDIYSVAAEFADLRSGDGVHYTEPGYKKFAEKIVADINRLLNI
jgi:hypothetical protein